ncbi:unnamed protein product [Calicophoron daubneyi]
MASEMGISPNHFLCIENFMRFAKFQNKQTLNTFNAHFDGILSSRVDGEVTFTVDEVREIVETLRNDVLLDVETEFMNMSYVTIVLLRQLFKQAEKWHLRMIVDISELEDLALLNLVRSLGESREAICHKGPIILDPLSDKGAADLLRAEISRLQDENARLREDVSHTVEVASHGDDYDQDTLRLQKEIDSLRSELDDLKLKNQKNEEDFLEDKLTEKSEELIQIRSLLQLAEIELEQKVSETAPFKNLKQMLLRKNEQLKELREKLSYCENFHTNKLINP